MFRDGVSYFRKNWGEAVKQKPKERPHDVYRDLLKALEGARTLLAIAIAEETKATPLQRWKYYLETSEQMRRGLKQLRALPSVEMEDRPAWLEALESLREIPPWPGSKSRQGEANQLFQQLRGVIVRLGKIGD